MSLQHPVERGGEGRGTFERVAERASNIASSPLFFGACCLIVAAWMGSYVLGWSDPVRFFLGDLIGAVTLVLLAVLKNTERRAEHAIQFKLDAIAQAMLEQRRGVDDGGLDDLERAIGRHDEV